MKTVSETLIDAEDVVYYYDSMKSGLNFEEYVLSVIDVEKVRVPVVRFSRASLFDPVEASRVVIKLNGEIREAPLDVLRFLGGLSNSFSEILTASGFPDKPVVSVSAVRNGGKLVFEAGRTFLHDVFLSHHLADFKVGGETLRDIFSGEVVRFAKKLSKPLLPAPLKLNIAFLSRDGYILLSPRGNPFSPDKRQLSPVSVYPNFPFGKDAITLSELVRKAIPEELAEKSTFRVYSAHVDVRTLGEVVLGVLVVSKMTAMDIKRHVGRVLPLNVVRLPGSGDFTRRRVTVIRVIAESITSFSGTVGVSYEAYTLLNE